MNGLLAWLREPAPPAPRLLDILVSQPLAPSLGRDLIGGWTRIDPATSERYLYTLLADGTVRIERWSR